MIREVEGDILLSKAEYIAHGVAPNDDFKTGLALSLRERWPGMYKDFRHYCQSTHPKSGEMWVWGGVDHSRIISLFTQEGNYHGDRPGKAQLDHVNHALRELRKYIEGEKVQSLALPRLATGVGGLDWNDVKPLVEKHLGDLTIPVYVYTTFKANQQANEQ